MALLDLLRIASPQSLVGPGIHHQGVGARDVNARLLQALHFLWAIGQESDRTHAQILSDLCRSRIVSSIGRIAEAEVGLGLGPPLGLERPAAHEGQMPMASALLIQPNDEAAAVLLDQCLGKCRMALS
jgi:hypothetical protein